MDNDEKKIQNYHRLADVTIRTLATILAVLFAYVLASPQLNPILKISVTSIWLLILLGIIASSISLFSGEKEIRIAKAGAYIGIILMLSTIVAMILFLSAIMYSMP